MKYSFKLIEDLYGAETHSGLRALASSSSNDLEERLNAQIGALEDGGLLNLADKYSGIYVARIVEARPHPGADRLQICLVDDGGVNRAADSERGEQGLLQVVCGASNARAGIDVAWISPGATVPATFNDAQPFVLSKIKIRDEFSNGMLASIKELDLGDGHEEILEVSAQDAKEAGLELKPGLEFKNLYRLDDIVVDFENKMFTHRADCFGHLGIARDLAGIQNKRFKSPDWYLNVKPNFPKATAGLSLEVENKVPESCPRYMAVVIEGVKVAPSPLWLKTYLKRLGIRPLNNIVDITNYLMILTGQPLHAFDFDKVAGSQKPSKVDNAKKARIVIRLAKQDEAMTLLGAKQIKLGAADLLITDSQEPIALGGVMGSNNSEVDESTVNLILESATFDMYAVRRTSMRHGLFTDAATRYTKGQPAAGTAPILFKAMEMIQELLPGAKFGQVQEVAGGKPPTGNQKEVDVSVGSINALLGLDLDFGQVTKILQAVEIGVEAEKEAGNKDKLKITAPFWRPDLEIEEDVIEEIGRLYGFNKIAASLPVRPVYPPRRNSLVELKTEIRDQLKGLGANELSNYSFVSSRLLERSGQNSDQAFTVRNALSPNLEKYRLSLMPSLLEKVHPNIKDGFEKLVIFEIGKTHIKGHLVKDGQTGAQLPEEFQRLALLCAAKDRAVAEKGVQKATQKGTENKKDGGSFYLAKRYLGQLLDDLGVKFQLEN